MSFSSNRFILNPIIVGFISILLFYSCEELEPINPADPAYTLKAPTLTSAQAITDVQIDLTWQNNEEHTEEFVVSRKIGAESYRVIGTVAKNILTFTDTACVLGVEYHYVVQSTFESKLSDYSNVSQGTTSFAEPSNLNVIVLSDETIGLTWTSSTNFNIGFMIQCDAGNGFIEIGTVSSDVTEYTVSGLTFGDGYRVAAYTTSNNSAYSAIARVPLIDFDGNVYETIQIGDQVWMAENLKVTHYRDGTVILHLTADEDWTYPWWLSESSGAYCYYDNSTGNGDTYGALYNCFALTNNVELALEGWHVPTDSEWQELEMYIGMSQLDANDTGYRGANEGSQLANIAYMWDDGALENDSNFGSSGFNALPGGSRNFGTGEYYNKGKLGNFWSASESNSADAWYRSLDYNNSGISRNSTDKRNGFAVRLLRD